MATLQNSKTPKSPSAKLAQSAGRPQISVTVRQLRQIEDAAACGLSQVMIARVTLGVAESTWHEIKDRDCRISGAISLGRARGAIAVGKALLKRAKAGDMAAIRWYESTRLGMMPGGPSIEEEDERMDEARLRAMPREEVLSRLMNLLNEAATRRDAQAEAD